MSTETKTYNGWTNYETWNVKLWLDNDEGSYRYWQDKADEILGENTEDVPSDKSRNGETADEKVFDTDTAANDLAGELESEIKDNAPEVSGCYADLLNAALGEVNWYEIAASLIDEARERATE